MSFKDDGYIELCDFFTISEIEKLEAVFVKFILSQAKKIGEYRDLALSLSLNESMSNKDKFVSLYETMEKNDKEALYQFQKLFYSFLTCLVLYIRSIKYLLYNIFKSIILSLMFNDIFSYRNFNCVMFLMSEF